MGRGTWSDSTTEDGRAREHESQTRGVPVRGPAGDRPVAPSVRDPNDPGGGQWTGDPYITLTTKRISKSPTTRARAPTSRGCADCTLVPPPLQRWTRFPAGPATA